MDYLEYKGYKGSVEYSKEDNCLFGKVQGMSKALILYEGNTLDELRKDFEEGVDSYLECCSHWHHYQRLHQRCHQERVEARCCFMSTIIEKLE